jgi:glutamine phosphoribosylpyrophosphate amidotransferase
MTMIIDGTNGLTFNNATTQASAGQVLQVVNVAWTGYQGISSSTYADVTGSSIAITPKFSTSKVLVLITLNGCGKNTNNTCLKLKLQRNGADVITITDTAFLTQTTIEQNGAVCLNFLDNPASTSAQTYKLQLGSLNNNTQAWVNNFQSTNGYSTITLMEIAQ